MRYAPTSPRQRIDANLAALRLLRDLAAEQRPATSTEQAVLARWSGWGAAPVIFDPGDDRWAEARDEVRGLVSDDEWHAAQQTVLNAHYTDPAVAAAMWSALTELGFEGGRVLEPGCGSGHFIGLAPRGVAMVGVEKDPTTARVARALYPDADIRAMAFQDFHPREPFAAAIGNVPFAEPRAFKPTCAKWHRRFTGQYCSGAGAGVWRYPDGLVSPRVPGHRSALADSEQIADWVGLAVVLPSPEHAGADPRRHGPGARCGC